MSSTLNDTMKTAIHGVESVREGTEHTLASTFAALVKGANTVSGIVTMLRGLDRDDGLAWFGLARRRHPLSSAATFGAGMALGAGLALVFAPMTGAEMRAALLGKLQPRTKAQSRAAEPPVKDSAPKGAPPVHQEKDLGYGASHGYNATHGGPTGPGDAPASVPNGTRA